MDEREDNELEYQLNDPGDIQKQIKAINRKRNIIIGITSVLILFLFGVIVLYVIKFILGNKDGGKDKNNSNNNNTNNNTEIKSNYTSEKDLQYGDNNKIENTFKSNGSNYNSKLGEINKGQNYIRNPKRNLYDLFIPNNLDKNKYNKILLFIHGGAWIMGDKSDMNLFCEPLASQGFIVASMAHTFVNDTNFNHSIFRILDEVASAIKSIKNKLKEKGFNETKLELAIGGGSSGSHIALLYAYSYKKSPMEIKFAINIVGPVTLESKYYYTINNYNVTLDKIDDEQTIKKYEEEKKIVPMNNGTFLVNMMNLFLGNQENDNIEQMFKSPEKKEIDTESQKYKELLEKAKFGFPITYINKNTVPTLCLYAGKDTTIGVKHYSYLKSTFDINKNTNISLKYLPNSPHTLYVQDSLEFQNGIKEFFLQIINYSNKYFTQNNK